MTGANIRHRPQSHYWHNVLQLELLFLQFLRSQRDPNFDMYVETLRIIPWMFAHYARWMTIHVNDLLELQLTCPTIYAEFQKGNFATQKTRHMFSSLANERLNEIVKGDGGIVSITESESSLNRWKVGGPELARLLNEYNEKYSADAKSQETPHDQIPSVQKKILYLVQSVTM